MPLRLKASRVAERLDALAAEARVVAGRSDDRETADGFWMALHRTGRAGRPVHVVTLSWGVPPRRELARLAWGLRRLDRPEPLRWVGRTNRRGEFTVRGLAEGEYAVRYVPLVREAFDVAVLECVGDRAARRLLRSAAEAHAAADLGRQAREAAERLEPRPINGAEVRWPGRTVLVSTAPDAGGLALTLTLAADVAAPGPMLARVRVGGRDEKDAFQTFIALDPRAGGKNAGETRLTVPAEIIPPDGGPLYLQITPRPAEALRLRSELGPLLRGVGGAADQEGRAALLDAARRRFGGRALCESLRSGQAAMGVLLANELQRLIASFAPAGVAPEQCEARAVVDALVEQALGTRLSSLTPAERRALYDSAARAYHAFLLQAEGRAADTALSATTAALTQHTRPAGAKEQALLGTDAVIARVYRLHKYAGRSVETIAQLLDRDVATVAAFLEHAEAYVAS